MYHRIDSSGHGSELIILTLDPVVQRNSREQGNSYPQGNAADHRPQFVARIDAVFPIKGPDDQNMPLAEMIAKEFLVKVGASAQSHY
jgi:hypothetical protein